MTPGHNVALKMMQDQTVYLKFSYPSISKNSSLFLSIEHVWGDFEIFISKSKEFPNSENNDFMKSFNTMSSGLLDSLQTIPINTDTFKITYIQGIYYLAIKSKSSCFINLKFYEKSKEKLTDKNFSIHSLTAGKQTRGNLESNDEVLYYTIKLSLDKTEVTKAFVNLTPLKGNFLLFANDNPQLPTKDKNVYFSENNILELPMNSNSNDEYIIGV